MAVLVAAPCWKRHDLETLAGYRPTMDGPPYAGAADPGPDGWDMSDDPQLLRLPVASGRRTSLIAAAIALVLVGVCAVAGLALLIVWSLVAAGLLPIAPSP
jgi:hypothetical protein